MSHTSPPRRREGPAGPRNPFNRVLIAVAILLVFQDFAFGARPVPAYAPGYPMLFPRPVEIRPRGGALVAADFERDGRTELVAAIPSGLITVVEAGAVRPGWPRRFNDLPSPAYPVGRPGVGDLDGDGVDEVVICVSAGSWPRRAVVFALDAGGRDLPGWPVEIPAGGAGGGCAQGATLVVDFDGDGRAEVARALHGGGIVIDGSGAVRSGWPFKVPSEGGWPARSINADPAAADVDGDGRPDLLLVESGYQPRLFALDAGGRLLPRFPRTLAEVVDRQAPAAGDLDDDGTAEMVQATLPFEGLDEIRRRPAPVDPVTPEALPRFGRAGPVVVPAPSPVGSGAPTPGPAVPAALHLLRYDAYETPGWPLPLGAGAARGAQIARLDGEALPTILQEDGDRLAGYDAEGAPRLGFPIALRGLPSRVDARQDSGWTVADFDGNGRTDFLRAIGIVVAGNATLRVVGMRPPGMPLRGFPFSYEGLLPESDLVAADLDGDGATDLALLVGEGTYGGWRLLVWGGGRR